MANGNDYVTPYAILTLATYGMKPFPSEDLVGTFFTQSTSTSAIVAESLANIAFDNLQSVQVQPFFAELLQAFDLVQSSTTTPFDVGCF